MISAYAEMVLIELYTKESLGNEVTIRFAIAGATHILTNNLTEQSIKELIGLICRSVSPCLTVYVLPATSAFGVIGLPQ